MKAFEIEDNSALGLLAFTPAPILSEPTTSANLAHAIITSNGHYHGHTAISDAGTYSHGHRVTPQNGSASLVIASFSSN